MCSSPGWIKCSPGRHRQMEQGRLDIGRWIYLNWLLDLNLEEVTSLYCAVKDGQRGISLGERRGLSTDGYFSPLQLWK